MVGWRRRSRASGDPATRPLWGLLAPFLGPHRGKLGTVAAAAFAGGLAEAGILVLIARTALAIAAADARFEVALGPVGEVTVSVPVMLVAAGVLVVLRVGLLLLQSSLTVRTLAEIGRTTRRALVELYLGATWSLQSDERRGRLQQLVNVAVVGATTAQWIVNCLVAGLSFAALIATAFVVDALASLVVGALAVLLAVAFHPLRTAVRRRARCTVEADMALATAVTEVSSLAREIRIFEAEPAVRDVLGARVDDAARRRRSQQFLADVIPATYQGAALGLVVAALAVVHLAGVTRLSALSAVVLIMLRSLNYGLSFQRSVQGIHETAPNLEILTDELDRLRAAQVPRGGEPVPGIGSLAFEHVSFSYDGERHALRDVSFVTRRGEVIGIVGPSGAGKSTLVQLVLRLREPTAGRILADGRDVSSLALDDWYRHVTYVPQEAGLFAGTVRENIRFFRDDVTDDQVVAAAKLANLHQEIAGWPEGYATPVGEHGSRLSGGQRQRLCIARALVTQPDVLVLDEPTSSLDVRSETLIREALRTIAASGEVTIFIVAHRLSTLAICDRIMVLQSGALVGFDTPDRLAATTPLYREALELAGLR